MIKANKGEVEYEGVTPDLMTDLVCIIHALRDNIPDELIHKAIDVAFMTEERMLKDMTERVNRMSDYVKELSKHMEDSKVETAKKANKKSKRTTDKDTHKG